MIENTRHDVKKMFFLTKTNGVEITSFQEVFNCGNQALLDPRRPDLDFDKFGRNYTDRQFVELCFNIYRSFLIKQDSFQLLSCKKVDDQYIARLELSNETLEMELSEMVVLLEERCKAGT